LPVLYEHLSAGNKQTFSRISKQAQKLGVSTAGFEETLKCLTESYTCILKIFSDENHLINTSLEQLNFRTTKYRTKHGKASFIRSFILFINGLKLLVPLNFYCSVFFLAQHTASLHFIMTINFTLTLIIGRP
jgi:hypothetical protein